MAHVFIFESDPAVRTVLYSALDGAGLSESCQVCDVSDVQDKSAGADDPVYIWIGEDRQFVPPGISVKESNFFVKPLRLGSILDHIRRNIDKKLQKNVNKSLIIGDYRVNFQNNGLKNQKNGKIIHLTEKEVHILQFLSQNQDKIVSRRELLDEIWGYAEGVETHTLETHIYRLRQKIEQDPADPHILITEDQGYRLRI